jgi:hypothetical protein
MTRSYFFLSFIFLFGATACVGQGIVSIDKSKIKNHPRILFSEGEEDVVRKKIEIDLTYNFLHKIIIKECDQLVLSPPEGRILSGGRLLKTARECRRRIFFLAYAYRITRDTKYLFRAEQELVSIAAFPDWNPSHFLDVAEMTMGMAIGYDWLYNGLSVKTRSLVEQAIIRKGLEPSLIEANNAWLKANHNWNQVCNAGMAYGALAVMDLKPDLAKAMLDRAITTVKLPMDQYLPDGAYPEGYGYWAYGTSFNVLLISALEKAFESSFGLAEHPGFLKTGYYLQQMVGTSGQPFNYSDNDSKAILNPAMAWFASRLNDPSLLSGEVDLILNQKNLHRIRELPAFMIWVKDLHLGNIPPPKTLQWVGQGKTPVALIRSSWDKSNGIFVGLKGGSPSAPHAHMDVGSFVMDALGKRWAMDLGVQEYYSLESKGLKIWYGHQESDRWKVFRNSNFSHNTITLNKSLQSIGSDAHIISSTTQPDFQAAVVDLTSLYPGVTSDSKRGIGIVNGEYVVVRDELQFKTATSLRWNMATPAVVNVIDNKTAELTQDGKKVTVWIAEPEDAVLTTWSADPPAAYDAPNPGVVFLGFEYKRPAGQNLQITVYLIPESCCIKQKKTIPPIVEWSDFSLGN